MYTNAVVLRKRNDYIELEQSIKSSNELLHSLESYLSTFQTDLSAVSGQISELQQKSSDIESQLKGRKASSIFIRDWYLPLSNLINRQSYPLSTLCLVI